MTAVATTQDTPGPAPRFADAATRRRIIEGARTGMAWKYVADHARIARRTLYTWRERGMTAALLEEQGQPVPELEQQYLDFWRELLAARSDSRVRAIALVHAHAERDAPTARWLAERLDREQFHIDRRMEVMGEVTHQHQHAHVVVQYDTTDQEKADRLLVALAEAGVLEVPGGQPAND